MFPDKHCHDFEYSETQLVARVPSSLHPTMKYESGILSPCVAVKQRKSENSVRHPSNLLFKNGKRIAAVALTAFVLVVGSRFLIGGQQGSANRIDIGYAAIQTVVTASQSGTQERLTPGVLVRIYGNRDHRESFAFSNPDGVAYVPLRPGHYCFEAFNREGVRIELTRTQARCFEVKKNEDTQVGVELLSLGKAPTTPPN